VAQSELDFETLAAHAGMGMRLGDTTATVAPISASTTYSYDSVEEIHSALGPDPKGYAYARNANPTVVALEQSAAALEGTEQAIAFGSGMAAIHAAFLGIGIESGDTIVVASDLYGVTRTLLGQFEAFGVETRYVDILDLEEVERVVIETRARAVYFESISNPLLRVADVDRLVEIGRAHRAVTLIDNTFATPYLLRPSELGVDIVIHSATKYIAGHGDVMAGLVVTNASYGKRVLQARTAHGSVLSPFEAWLTLRGIRTMPLRMQRQCDSARRIAEWLVEQEWVGQVHYPGLASHRQHALAARLFDGRFGGMVAFDLRADQRGALTFIDRLKLITAATSLGDAASLVLYPPLSSHRTLSPDELRRSGIGEGLIRLSVGLESPRDLCQDLEQAADQAHLRRLATSTISG